MLAAILTAGIIASGSGVISRIVYRPHVPEEPAYPIEVAATEDGEAGGEGPAVSLAALLADASVEDGQAVAKKCASCHSFEEGGANKIGPALWGVVGRDIASVGGFAYSDALASQEGVWDYESLGRFLANPKGWAPGTKMAFAGLKKDQDLADAIAYLRSISPDAPPVPEPEAEPAAAEGATGDAEAGQAATGEQAAATAEPAAEGGDQPAQAAGSEQVAAVEPAEQTTGQPGAAGQGEGSFATLLAAADPAAGEKAAKKCAACHSFEQGGTAKIGPPLWGVLGRDIASAPDFRYSNALAEKDGSWDYGNLHAYLANPKEWAPGNKMAFAGIKKPEELADIIVYLRSLSDSPEPLPAGG
ncbi:MAG TPA: cytochrome c family protein [Geminicoccaceae bacterium]|nr:cytochrome c family protein [Geminicoccaceae bacterium]